MTSDNELVSDAPERLPIATRRVLSGDGEVTEERSVFCPPRDASVPIEACLGCEYCLAVSAPKDRNEGFVLCTEQTCGGASAIRAMDRPLARCHRSAEHTPASAVMTRNVICVRADVGVDTLRVLVLDRKI